jgi:hypothetical protein
MDRLPLHIIAFLLGLVRDADAALYVFVDRGWMMICAMPRSFFCYPVYKMPLLYITTSYDYDKLRTQMRALPPSSHLLILVYAHLLLSNKLNMYLAILFLKCQEARKARQMSPYRGNTEINKYARHFFSFILPQILIVSYTSSSPYY